MEATGKAEVEAAAALVGGSAHHDLRAAEELEGADEERPSYPGAQLRESVLEESARTAASAPEDRNALRFTEEPSLSATGTSTLR